uniref:Integrase catalytic domain-containing protein n=1 Tax=Nicotiana tabacum TaxID=4097 RepID=A0A1S4CJJ2_TOBAC|nr:PREDICTED: uncharacterized protein LOC107819568 [Nicotiana tabacum]
MEESTNDLLKKLLIDNQQLKTDFKNLERQMGQLATNQNTRLAGALPSDIEKNPQVNAITLRNGRELEEVPKKKKDKPIPEGELIPKVTHEPKNVAEITEPVEAPRPPPPFLRRLQKKNDDRMFTKFFSILSQVQLNIPLVDVLREIPNFTIHVRIGNIDVGHALCDLGASINLMPLSLFKQLGLGAPRPTTVTLQLADRSIAYPEGVIEDVLLQIGKFIFPADFIILDYEADELVPIILGRPFLATGDAIIKVREGKMILRVDDEEAVFNVYKTIQLPRHYEELSMISVVEADEQIHYSSVYLDDSLDKALMLLDSLGADEEAEEMMHILDTSCAYIQGIHPFEPLNNPEGPPPKPSIEEEEKLLRVLHELKRAFGWTMSDIKGIIPAFCMHKILMEDGHKPSVEQQCRLNPIMKEVVRKEVIKWLDACIVFPISDSKWVDKAKVEAIEKLPPPISVKGIHSFLGHAFEELKGRLVTAPIIIAPDWEQPFELMCDASDLAIGAVLGQRRNKIFHSIYYASKTLNPAQINYTVTKKELLAVVWAFDKFRSYLVGTKVIVYTDHSAIRYLFNKKDAKPRLIWWVLLLQEFNLEIRDRKGIENQLLAITSSTALWYADYVNFIASGVTPPELTPDNRRRFLHDVRLYMWDEPFLYRLCADQLVQRCVPEEEMNAILHSGHTSPYGGHHGGDMTAQKVLQSGFYWPKLFRDAHAFVKMCDRCQRTGTITKKHEMPLQNILVEAIALPTNDAKVVVSFVKKHIFTRFGTPKVLISDGGTHFCNKLLNNVLAKYGVKHKVSTAYHPQTSGQVEVSNREVKRILKKTVSANRKDWARKLEDALWAYRTAYKNPIGKLKSRWSDPFVVVSVKPHGAVELRDMSSTGIFLVNGQRIKHYWGGDFARHKTSEELTNAGDKGQVLRPSNGVRIGEKLKKKIAQVRDTGHAKLQSFYLGRTPDHAIERATSATALLDAHLCALVALGFSNAQAHFGEKARKMPILERGINVRQLQRHCPHMYEELVRRGLHTFINEPGEGNAMVVREFYANVAEHDNGVAMVRRRAVSASVEAIQMAYQLPLPPVGYDDFYEYDRNPTNEKWARFFETICAPGKEVV